MKLFTSCNNVVRFCNNIKPDTNIKTHGWAFQDFLCGVYMFSHHPLRETNTIMYKEVRWLQDLILTTSGTVVGQFKLNKGQTVKQTVTKHGLNSIGANADPRVPQGGDLQLEKALYCIFQTLTTGTWKWMTLIECFLKTKSVPKISWKTPNQYEKKYSCCYFGPSTV